jgi:hypothetical protein
LTPAQSNNIHNRLNVSVISGSEGCGLPLATIDFAASENGSHLQN